MRTKLLPVFTLKKPTKLNIEKKSATVFAMRKIQCFKLAVLVSVSCLIYVSTRASAGEIVSPNGNNIRIEFNSSDRTVRIEGLANDEQAAITLSIDKFYQRIQLGSVKVKTQARLKPITNGSNPWSANPQKLFRSSNEALNDAREDFGSSIVGYFVPFYNINLFFGHAVDVAGLPINFAWKAIRHKWAKHDLEIIYQALNTNDRIEVSNNTFRRLPIYFESL
jgi:hypothetical protein